MRFELGAALLFATLISACASPEPPAPAPPMVGGDRDAHGCIPSAGYAWCTRSDQCERPWELAQKQGFAPDMDAFEAYCSAASK